MLVQLEEQYPQELRVIYRDFPLLTNPGHEKAGLAAQASHAAALQDKFWEMHALLFNEQDFWSPLDIDEFDLWLVSEATDLGMNATQFTEDLRSDSIIEKVEQAFIYGEKVGMPGTPFLLINGQIYSGPADYGSLNQIISLISLGARQFTNCPPKVVDPSKEYLAILKFEKGEVVIQFYPEQAPIAVNNFIFLAQEGWYNGNTFHRVLPEYFAESGDPSGTGQGNPGYFFKNEIDPSLSFDRPGVVAMKNLGPDTNGSQFFITYAAVPSYDGKYTIFGQVLSGMEILEELKPRDPQFGEILPPGDTLLGVTIEER